MSMGRPEPLDNFDHWKDHPTSDYIRALVKEVRHNVGTIEQQIKFLKEDDEAADLPLPLGDFPTVGDYLAYVLKRFDRTWKDLDYALAHADKLEVAATEPKPDPSTTQEEAADAKPQTAPAAKADEAPEAKSEEAPEKPKEKKAPEGDSPESKAS